MGKNLFEKVFDLHIIRELAPGQYQLFVGLHLIHEATSAPAFSMLEERGLGVAYPQRTFATADHIIPTDTASRPFVEPDAEAMVARLERNTEKFGIRFFAPSRRENGIVHVVAPEYGLSQPGMIIVCGDSHTSTHGAFGAIALGIGTTQVRDVLATQTLIATPLKVRQIRIDGSLPNGVYAKDVALHIIKNLGVQAGIGFAYEFAGDVVDDMSMEERMTLCNMSIEGGARCGYVCPDQTTYEYLRGREYAPKGQQWDAAVEFWDSVASDSDADYADVVTYLGDDIEPMVTWGISPSQCISVKDTIPHPSPIPALAATDIEAQAYMGVSPGDPVVGTKIDWAFIGSCTNGRFSDFVAASQVVKNRKVAPHVRALIVPGSQKVREELASSGIGQIFIDAGFELREPGCSMCVGLNSDKLSGSEVCASSSNRNFKGRQGSPTGRTLLMSPRMVASAAINGFVVDER